jgi:hypothetical protein
MGRNPLAGQSQPDWKSGFLLRNVVNPFEPRQTASLFSGTGSFDGGVEREKIGLFAIALMTPTTDSMV